MATVILKSVNDVSNLQDGNEDLSPECPFKNNMDSFDQDVPFSNNIDPEETLKYIWKMHNYCCNPQVLKKKYDDNQVKLSVKKKELGAAKKKIKTLKNRIVFLRRIIKDLKENKTVENEVPITD